MSNTSVNKGQQNIYIEEMTQPNTIIHQSTYLYNYDFIYLSQCTFDKQTIIIFKIASSYSTQ